MRKQNKYKGFRYNGNRVGRLSRILMEQHLGRELLPGEEVHHINGDTLDDRIENLQVLTKSQHSSITAKKQHAEGNFGRAMWAEGAEEDVSKRQSERMKNKPDHAAKMRAGWTPEHGTKISQAMMGNTNGKKWYHE